jgi:hypothetical protein
VGPVNATEALMQVAVRYTRVLVVDDEPVFRIPLGAVLTAAGFDLSSAELAEAAEGLLTQEPVHVVLKRHRATQDGRRHAGVPPSRHSVRIDDGLAARRSAAAEALAPTVRARLVKPLDVTPLLALPPEARMATARGRVGAEPRAAARQ